MDLVIRTAIVFLLILVLTRAVGRRELGSLEPFDLIMLVVIGDLVQQGVTQSDYSITGTVIVISTLGVLTVATSWLSFRVAKLRVVLEGEPTVLVADGKVLQNNLRRERLTVDEIAAEARQQQVATIDDVRWAILETSGKISVIPKEGGSG